MNETIVESLRVEETRLESQLSAVRATLAAYSVPAMVKEALNGAARRSARKVVKAKPEKKARKKRIARTPEMDAEVMRLSRLPENERPTIPEIARKMGIADTTVQRIRAEANAATTRSPQLVSA